MTGEGPGHRMAVNSRQIKIALSGDVMTGRGIDQVLPHPCDPQLHEDYVKSARDYVALAEAANGPIPQPVDFAYVWGDMLAARRRLRPDAWIVNLETAVTRSDDPQPKGINYRMSPENAGCLVAAGIDCCVLANNHVLDWGQPGLLETLKTLGKLGMKCAGAGHDEAAATAPAIIEVAGGRVIFFAFGSPTSGIPPGWGAGADWPGINLLAEISGSEAGRIAAQVRALKRPGDLVVVSLHWGGNWGYEIPRRQRRFARRLVETAGVDVVHGHSSHHPKGFEIHRGKPILYGCGDFLNDYEGISGHEAYRDDLVLLYVLTFEVGRGEAGTVALQHFELVPFRIRRFALTGASAEDTAWLRAMLERECAPFDLAIEPAADGCLAVRW